MAKLYILTPDQIQSGNRPKTPKEKVKVWKKACIILTAVVLLETALLLKLWMH